jgi:uncharacterized protein (TIGR03083 family)
MEITEHIAALRQEGEQLAAAAELAGVLAPVPSCPGWQVRDLLRHLGYVHRWAAGYVRDQITDMVDDPSEAELLRRGPADGDLVAWFRAGHAALLAALESAPPDLACWTFLPAPSPLAFWARRQAHETAIHRADADLAAGQATKFSQEFAADGIDELIMGFFARDGEQLASAQPAGAHQRLAVQATDAGRAWLVELTADGERAASVRRLVGSTTAGPTAACVLAGPASGLYLLLWNRTDPDLAGVAVTGDTSVLRAWRGGMHVTWS